MGPQNQVAQKEPSIFADNFGASSEKIAQTKSQRVTLKNIADPSREYQDHTPLRIQSKKYPRSWTTPYKTKIKPNGKMPTVIDISVKYGSRSLLTYQPEEGPCFQAQDKNADRLKDTSTVNHKCASV